MGNTFYPRREVGKVDESIFRDAHLLGEDRDIEGADAEGDEGADIADDRIAEKLGNLSEELVGSH